MSIKNVRDLFASDIYRQIEEVIKVDQTDEQVIHDEISEYIVTDAICRHYDTILDRYLETPNKPHEGVAVWVSGFFGSGKSSFAKMLGLAIENRMVQGKSAAVMFGQRTGSTKVQVQLSGIVENIPTDAVIFDVSTDRGIRSGSQRLTEIMYRLFLQHLGYARDLDLSELEIALEEEDRLDAFEATYNELFGKDWNTEKRKVALALSQASRVMHTLEPETFSAADSWIKAAQKRADITPGRLAERCVELMDRRAPNRSLVFVVDEVGQFVARDIQKMLDLQAIVQNLGRVGRGRMWIVVTSQEKLGELVGGLDDKRVELARLMDRFPLQVHLEPSDISEVTSKRVLSKNAAAQTALRGLYTRDQARLSQSTRLSAAVRLPELSTESFVDLYPLLPYHIDLIIDVVSGLRTQGGASKHVGGANRTIIKLAQQLLIHPDVKLAEAPLGTLARIDQIYDLISGNIGSEVRGKIDTIGAKVPHPMAQKVAKAICLLQYVKNIHRTAENIAATLHEAVDADSCLSQVREALQALLAAGMVLEGEDGYRIPTPAEDDWATQRRALSPRPGDIARIQTEVITGFWKPQPAHTLEGTKQFKAALYLGGREIEKGDVPVHLTLAEAGKDCEEQTKTARTRSQTEDKSIFWVVGLDHAVEQETAEFFRSREMISRKERGARSKEESALVADEKRRQRRHEDELKRLIRDAALAGAVYFRGNDRSPEEGSTDLGRTASRVLAEALPQVFTRFSEGAAKVTKKDLDSLMTTENLRGLTPVFSQLDLVRDEGSKPVFNTDSGPLQEVLALVENQTSYGEMATGRFLVERLGREPFGWDFEVVRLLAVSLLRAGKLEATSKSRTIESALSIDARNTFPNNNLFRQASFRPRVSDCTFEDVVKGADNFRSAFGHEVPELEEGVLAAALREEVDNHEDTLRDVLSILQVHGLPGAEVLQDAANQLRTVGSSRDCAAVLAFNASHQKLKEAIRRAAELQVALEPRIDDVSRAKGALRDLWPFLEGEPDLEEPVRTAETQLRDLLQRENFYKDLPAIDQHAKTLEDDYQRRYRRAVNDRAEAYQDAVVQLKATPGWEDLHPDKQEQVAAPLASKATTEPPGSPGIPVLRADLDACPTRLAKAEEEMMRILDGQRLVTLQAASYFSGGIETEEQLDSALTGIREECERLIGAGKKVLVR